MSDTDHDYQDVLREQCRFLRKSCAEFDAGDVAEAKRLAVGLRNLLHGNQRDSPAVLEELGLHWLPVLDTRGSYHPRDIAPYFGLISFYRQGRQVLIRWDGDERALYQKRVALSEWRTQPVFDDRAGIVFSRIDLVRSVADQDGGAHVKRKFGPKYRELFRKTIPDSFGVRPEDVQGPEHAQYYAVRQIAHELLRGIDVDYSPLPQPLRPGLPAIRGISAFLLPGRRMTAAVDLRPNYPWDAQLQPAQGDQEFMGPMIRLPYEDMSSDDPCCCGSDLRFHDCCKTPHEFPDAFIEAHVKRYDLPITVS